jgi:hypothetical protein
LKQQNEYIEHNLTITTMTIKDFSIGSIIETPEGIEKIESIGDGWVTTPSGEWELKDIEPVTDYKPFIFTAGHDVPKLRYLHDLQAYCRIMQIPLEVDIEGMEEARQAEEDAEAKSEQEHREWLRKNHNVGQI